MKISPIETVLENDGFTEKEKAAFMEIIQYAKACQQTGRETLKDIVNSKVEEVVNNEISQH